MDLCTIHQRMRSGYPVVQGSEIRLPDGTSIPGVVSIHTEAVTGDGLWRTTVVLHATFGEPIPDAPPILDPAPVPTHDDDPGADPLGVEV